MPKIQRAPSLQERAYQLIRQSITAGEKCGGEPLVVDQLASEFGVSRTPVREALVRLEQEGLVESVPSIGTFVFRPSREQVAHIFQVRAVLESLAVELAAPHISDEQLHQMRERLARVTEGMNREYVEDHFQVDTELHDLFLDNAPNGVLRQVLVDLRDRVHTIRVFSRDRAGDHLMQSHREHVAIIGALIDRDAETAAALMRGHIERAGRRIVALLDERKSDSELMTHT
jgi:DNA-binding GntR family transcriptional regulator